MNIVIGIKQTMKENEKGRLARDAISQMKDRNNAYDVKGRTILYGIAFKGEDPFIVSRSWNPGFEGPMDIVLAPYMRTIL